MVTQSCTCTDLKFVPETFDHTVPFGDGFHLFQMIRTYGGESVNGDFTEHSEVMLAGRYV